MKVYLVYQAGIANVFLVDRFTLTNEGRNAGRVQQGAFGRCEAFAAGMARAGAAVRSAYCNKAGDISAMEWSDNLDDAPFSDRFCPVRADGWQVE